MLASRIGLQLAGSQTIMVPLDGFLLLPCCYVFMGRIDGRLSAQILGLFLPPPQTHVKLASRRRDICTVSHSVLRLIEMKENEETLFSYLLHTFQIILRYSRRHGGVHRANLSAVDLALCSPTRHQARPAACRKAIIKIKSY